MKSILLIIIFAMLWSSPGLRESTANFLRITANILSPTEQNEDELEFQFKLPFKNKIDSQDQ
ncbi:MULTISPECIES: hypothetical protein [unclassified Prochlorococcus]|uniref:hypothetical protein n=1 Tax=unclassified Prochlorococcus TaxID=2627481 RepID=UPI0005337FAF|nr:MULTISPECIES: hypothetical protein [unclassified Prochlorococcus]KGG15582.1 hypothetical protein EV06_1456 [Prochlorococcus sp. MIT 0602]KGG17862.1 hypothetical protein EV07_1304 [Prochlorococcus sp. MIT 0603]